MLKKAASGVLVARLPATYLKGTPQSPCFLRPCWTALLTSLHLARLTNGHSNSRYETGAIAFALQIVSIMGFERHHHG